MMSFKNLLPLIPQNCIDYDGYERIKLKLRKSIELTS